MHRSRRRRPRRRRSRGRWRRPAAHRGDHRRAPAALREPSAARALRARGRARGGRWPAPARRRRRPGAGARQPQQPGHHGADLGLVGPAVAGDGGLDLARRVQAHRDAALAPRPAIATALACAVPMTVRTLCWLNTRSTATASGRERRSSRRRPARWRAAGRRCRPVGRRPDRPRRRPASSGRPGTPSTTPTPQRVRPGSTPSTRTDAPPRVRTLFGRHRQAAGPGPRPPTLSRRRHDGPSRAGSPAASMASAITVTAGSGWLPSLASSSVGSSCRGALKGVTVSTQTAWATSRGADGDVGQPASCRGVRAGRPDRPRPARPARPRRRSSSR